MKDDYKGKKKRKKNHQFLALCGWGDSNSGFIHFICDAYQLQETTVNRKSAKKQKKVCIRPDLHVQINC